MLTRCGRATALLLALVMMLVSPATVAAAATVQPLVELLRLAEAHDNNYLVQKLTAASSREDAPIALAALMPQVSAGLNAVHDNSDPSYWSADLSVTQAVYDLPQWHRWQSSRAQSEAAEIDVAAAREELRRDVIHAWLDVQLAADVLRLVDARLKTLREQLKRTEALAASGQVIESDVLSARAGLANARAQWEQSRHDLMIAHDVITRYTGAAAADLQLVSDAPLPALPALEQWLQQAEQSNLSLSAARQRTVVMRRLLEAAAAAVKPQLTFSGRFSARDDLGDVSDSWQLSLRQSLFTGGHLRARQRQLIADSDIAHERVAAIIAANALTMRRLHGQMKADFARIDALADAAAADAAVLQVVIVGYDNGVNIIADVLGAEEDLFDARLNLRQAEYSYLRNLVAARALTAATDDAFAVRIERLFTPLKEE